MDRLNVRKALRFLLFLFTVTVLISCQPNQVDNNPNLETVLAFFDAEEDQLDLATARLSIEKLLDPSINIRQSLKQIDKIERAVKKTPRFDASTVEGRLNGLVQYLYQAGPWNDNTIYTYDFDDPLGTEKPENGLLSNYLETKHGNCESMPILFLILAERLDLNVSLSTAPLHFFVRLEDEGHVYNFEATAGGLKQDASYIRDFNISKSAVRKGTYLQNLSKKEALAAMMHGLGTQYMLSGDFETAHKIADTMLEHYPKFVTGMLFKGSIWHQALMRELAILKINNQRVTTQNKKHLDELLANNLSWFEKAEALGWREPPADYDQRYLNMIEEARKYYE